MSEVKFSSFDTKTDDIYQIGNGVIPEIAQAFGHELTPKPNVENLGELIAKVGPAKTLQDNIEQARDALGVDGSAVDIAIDWADRSGLLVPVNRSFINSELKAPAKADTALITGGVRNWMQRRAELLMQMAGEIEIGEVVLAAGNRTMGTQEGPDVEEGMTEAEYLEKIIKVKLEQFGKFPVADVVEIDSGVGDEVMAAAAKKIGPLATTVVFANAGNWIQNVGQYKRAASKEYLGYDYLGNQVFVNSDDFPLARHGEPAATHQNPLTALGQIARNAQELARHQ